MKTLYFIIALICFNLSYAQKFQSTIEANGVYLSENDYQNHHLSYSFIKRSSSTKFIESWGHPNQVWIKLTDSIHKFYYSEIWGYRENAEDWRLYNGEAYIIEDTSKIIFYSIPIRANGFTGKTSYFSKNLNAPIYELTKNNLADVYHSNNFFIEKVKKLKWLDSIYKWDKKSHQYFFVNWLNQNGN